ncbi:LysR family transcriptional regulator [Priestia megaterium]|uniref:LysR family transcriptional regulator substrate-binding protein n=1 Tax=Priestia megaterium TaxID=1404 RepID=UPI000BF731D1|nr:LysR family transcriptional regulator substrate-binding protein [Priestia megaterium]PFI60724.1 LysR family transcriptional regulator [Priestia megaterium]
MDSEINILLLPSKEVKEVGAGVKGRLTLGVNTFPVVGLRELIQEFRTQNPKVTYKIHQNESAHLCKLVKERVLELGIVRTPLELKDFTVVHLYTEPFYFICSAKKQSPNYEVTLADIQKYPLIFPSTEGLGVHYVLLEAFSKAEIHPNIIAECSDIALLFALVSSDFGGAIVPETVINKYQNDNIAIHKIIDKELTASTCLVLLNNHYLSQAAQNFVNLITSHNYTQAAFKHE